MLDLLSSGGLAAKGLGGGTRGFRNIAFCSARRFYGAHVAKVCKPEVGGNRDAPWNKGIVGRNELLNKTCLLFSCFSPFLLISSLSVLFYLSFLENVNENVIMIDFRMGRQVTASLISTRSVRTIS